MQPGQQRGTWEEENKNLVLNLPYVLPVAKDAPGHVVFAIDVPAAYAKGPYGLKPIKGPAQCIIINRTRIKGAQISVEQY